MSRTSGQLLRHAPQTNPAEQEADVGGDRGEAEGCGEGREVEENERE